MRLLRFENGKFAFVEQSSDHDLYAILSHTWGSPEDEVTYQDILNDSEKDKIGYSKLQFCRDQAAKDGFNRFWIDTCCINKHNEAELSESIRLMYTYYSKAAVCYVFLSDVTASKRSANGEPSWQDLFKNSRWFTRGWTLQELIAPARMRFFTREGTQLGTKDSLLDMLSSITSIPRQAIQGQHRSYSHACRLSWASHREATKPEDSVYSLAGICDVQMGARYGEGYPNARARLEQKIRKRHGSIALDSADISSNIDSHHSNSTNHRAEGCDNIIELLKFDTMESRRDTISRAVAATCQWILAHPTYLSWRDEQVSHVHYGILWIKGKPGAGKSVLIKFLDQHITKQLTRDSIRMSFYFNARGNMLEKTFLGLYRSLLVQLLSMDSHLEHNLDDADCFHVTSGGDRANEILRRSLSGVVSKLSGKTIFCFIDALDECAEEDVESMISFFQHLQQTAFGKGNIMYFCFASRHYPIFDIPTSLEMDLAEMDEHQADLMSYIGTYLRRTTPKQKEQITREILSKANGVFLWVVIVVDILNKEIRNGGVHKIAHQLKELPPDLTQLFKAIILRDSDNVDEVMLCLRWILLARRPMKLREFYFAMMAGIDADHSQEYDRESISEEQMRSYLLSRSKGLAELTRGRSQTAQFIHESVRDFLVSDAGRCFIQQGQAFSLAHVHDDLKHVCLRMMGLDKHSAISYFSDYMPLNSEQRSLFIDRFPFLEYATSSLLYHADKAAQEVPQHVFLDLVLSSGWLDKTNLLERYKINLYKAPVDMVYVCAERNHATLIRSLLDRGLSAWQKSQQRHSFPLWAALATKSYDAALALLQASGAEKPTAVVQEMSGSNLGKLHFGEDTGLLWAIDHQLGHLASFMASQHRFCRGLTAENVATAVRDAAKSSSLKWMSQLISILRKANVNPKFLHRLLNMALLTATKHGGADMMKLLLREGADINCECSSSRHTPLPTREQDLAVDAWISVLDSDNWVKFGSCLSVRTVLTAAIVSRKEEAVNAALAAGARFNLSPHEKDLAFRQALENGHLDIVKLLVEKGCNVCAQLRHGGQIEYPIQIAVRSESAELVRLLLTLGAESEVKDNRGRSMLWFAVGANTPDILQLLLGPTSDLDALNEVLPTAACRGWYSAVQKMLFLGATANAKDLTGYSALMNAAASGHQDVVQLLVRYRASINLRDCHGRTALWYALNRNHLLVIKYLLNAGAESSAEFGTEHARSVLINCGTESDQTTGNHDSEMLEL